MGTGTGTGTFMLIKSGNCVYGVAMLFWVFRFRFRVATFFHLPPRVAPGRNRKGMTHPAPGCTCPLLLNRKNFVTDGGVKFRNEFSKLAHCNFCNTRVHGHEACGQEVCFVFKVIRIQLVVTRLEFVVAARCRVVGGGWLVRLWVGGSTQQLVLQGQNATSTWPQCGQFEGPLSRLSTCLFFADMFAWVPGILIHWQGKQKRKSQAICDLKTSGMG